jgi:hypothetical protein
MAWSIFSDGGGQEVAVGWAQQLLKLTGAPVTPGNTQFVYDWEVSEGGGGKFNPLNQGPVPGKPQWTTTGSQYGGGAADFASWQTGLLGASAYLHMPAYAGVLAGLRANDPVAARSALIASPWAASHYGGGANFSSAPVPGGKPVLPPLGAGGITGGAGGVGAGISGGGADPCLLGWTPIKSVIGIGPEGPCLFSRTNARALIGGLVIGGSLALSLGGVVVLVATAFTRTGAAGKVIQVAGVVPGTGRVAAAAGKVAAGAKRAKAIGG